MRSSLLFCSLFVMFLISGVWNMQGCGGDECQTDKDCIASLGKDHICRINESGAKVCKKKDVKKPTCDPACKSDETCENGTCKAKPKEGCTPACKAGEECKENKCVEVKKEGCDPPCHEAFECRQGKCVIKGAEVCEPLCKDGFVCKNKKCVEKQCQPPCTGGDICKLGKCIAKPKCQSNSQCGQGKVCKSGACIENTTCSSDKDCPTDKTCKDKKCVDKPACEPGCKVCKLGLCEDKTTTLYTQCSGGKRCSPGEACVSFNSKIPEAAYCMKRCDLNYKRCPSIDYCVRASSGIGFCRPKGNLRDSVLCSYDKAGPKIDRNQLCQEGYECIPLTANGNICKRVIEGTCLSNPGVCPKNAGCLDFKRGTDPIGICFTKCIGDKCPSTLQHLYCRSFTGKTDKFCFPK